MLPASPFENSKQSQDEILKVLLSDQSLMLIGILQDGIIKYANPTVTELTGYSIEEMMNWQPNKFAKFVHPEDRAFVMEQARKKQTGEKDVVTHYSYRIITKTGEIKWVDQYSKTIIFEGKPADFILVIDITEQKQAKVALQKSEEQYHRIIETSQEGIWVLDANAMTTFVNPRMAELLGYTMQEMLDMSLFEFMDEHARVEAKQRFEHCKEGIKEQHDFQFRRKDGSEIWTIITTNPLFDETGQFIGALGMITDITERKQAEEVLRRAEHEQRSILNSLSEHVIYHDPQLRIRWANRAAADSVGLTPEALIGGHCYEIWQLRSEPCEDCPVMAALETGKPQETEMKSPDGRVWFVRGYPVQDLHGNVVGMVEITLEITEWKRAEAALLASEEKYHTLFEDSRDAVYITTREGRFIDANSAVMELFGYSREELFQLNAQNLYVHLEDRTRFQQEIEQKDSVRDYEVKLRKKDGTVMDCLLTSTVRRARNGNIIGYHGVIRDITEQKRSEEALRESEEQFRLLSEQSLLAIVLLQDDVIKYTNQAAAKIAGYSQEEIMSWSPNEFAKLIHPEDRPFVMEQARKKQVGEKDVVTHYSCRIIQKSGEIRWVDIYSKGIVYEGRIANFTSLIDITEQKRGEIALKESEQKFRVVSESALVGLVIIQENQLKYANEAAARMAGYAREELLNWTIKDFMKTIYEGDKSYVLEQLQKKQTGSKLGVIPHYTIRLMTKTGELRWGEIFSKTIFYQGKPADLVTIIDTTQQKRAEEALRESETKYSTLVERAKDGVIIVLDGECMFANQALVEILGYSIDEIIGTSFLDLVSPESRDLVIQRYKEHMDGVTTPPFDEFKLQCKDGSTKDVEVSVGIIQYQGRPAIHGIVRDITERKRIRETQRALENKRANFIEITSHELRTPLTAIRGYTELLQQRGSELDQASRELCFEAINRNVQRLERLIKGVSTLRQLERGLFRLELQEVNFCDFLTEALKPYQTRLGRQLEFHSCPNGSTVIVDADPDRLLQVLDNLLENAIKQTPQNQRKIIVSTKIKPQTVQVQVIDNGIGINSEDLIRIFDPFVFIPTIYSASGTGIGLYLSQMIVNAHRGTLFAHSEGEGQGSIFTLELPRKEGELKANNAI